MEGVQISHIPPFPPRSIAFPIINIPHTEHIFNFPMPALSLMMFMQSEMLPSPFVYKSNTGPSKLTRNVSYSPSGKLSPSLPSNSSLRILQYFLFCSR